MEYKDTLNYPFEIRPLTDEEGGGWLITFPDLPGCMSDGETVQEAVENGRDAALAWLRVAEERSLPIPEPGSGGASGRFNLRLPKSLHTRLTALARGEGVSLNTLVVTYVAQCAGIEDRPNG